MILLQDLFTTLTTGVFANTAFSGTNGILKEIHYDKVINLVNLGIVEIYKRFKFLENELTLHIDPTVETYFLRSDRVIAVNSISTSKYIEEVTDVDGFMNIIKVTGAYDADDVEIQLNSIKSIPTIMSVATDIVKITNFTEPQIITLVYQSYPNKINSATVDPDIYNVNIPISIIDPLVAYIAAKTFKPMGSNDSTANADKSASYEQQYELACQKLLLYGLPVQDTTERDAFETKGWV